MKKLTIGNVYTTVAIDANTNLSLRTEFTVLSYDASRRYYTCAARGPEKQFLLPADQADTLYFEGYNLPFTLDTETPKFHAMNGKFNFVTGMPHKLRAFIDRHCLNLTEADWRRILYWPFLRNLDTKGTPLYDLPKCGAQPLSLLMIDTTPNSIAYTSVLNGLQGADYVLFPEKHQGRKDIHTAKAYLRRHFDVASCRMASETDWDDLYRSKIFRHPLVRHLPWYQINAFRYIVRRERRKGTAVTDFVKTYVLPRIRQTEQRYLKQYGERIYQ